MLTTPKNWTLVTYATSSWVDLVAEPCVIATVLVTNPSGSAVNCSLRLTASAAVLLPTVAIQPGESITLEVRSLSIPAADGIQINASAVGLHFIASGSV